MHWTRNMLIVAAICGTMAVAGRAADPPTGDWHTKLRFELADKTVLAGRIDAKAVAIRTTSGNVLTIPVAELTELTVGLNDRPGFVKRVEAIVKALDSAKTRENALRELIALGPAVTHIVSRHAASDVPERRLAIARILKAYQNWRTNHPDAPAVWARPVPPQTMIRAGLNTFVGTSSVGQFRVATPQGPVTVKLVDVCRVMQADQPAPGEYSKWWTVEFRDKTRIEGMAIRQSFRVQTRYGAVAVSLSQMWKATFADDGKTVNVWYGNGDKIVGTVEPETMISLKTGKGWIGLPLGKIAVVTSGLKAHSNRVSSVAFSPDGKRLASGSYDRTIKLWDTATGKEMLTIKGHGSSVTSISFSHDGKRLASGSYDKTVKLWDTASGTELLTIKGHSITVRSVAFSPDGKRLAVSSSSGYKDSRNSVISVWDAVTGKKFSEIRDPTYCPAVAWSPNGRLLAWGGAKVRDMTGGQRSFVLNHRPVRIYGENYSHTCALAFSPDSTRLASVDTGGTIMLWALATRKALFTLKGHSQGLGSVAFSPDGKRLASGSIDKTIKLWDTATGKEMLTIKGGHGSAVSSVAFSPDGKRLASGSGDGTINICEIPAPASGPHSRTQPASHKLDKPK